MALAKAYPKSSGGHYLIFRPEKVGVLDLLTLLFSRRRLTDFSFVESSASTALELSDVKASWFILFTLLVQKILALIRIPMKIVGQIVEFLLNLLSLNGGLFGLIWHIITVSVKIPKSGTAEYRSILAHIDERLDLYKNSSLINHFPLMETAAAESFGANSVKPLDLTMMAAKVAYENEAYIKNAVTNHWKMYFVGFFDCWNKFLGQNGTQAFVFCDKEQDANVIVVAFRGTEPFNAEDWSTDVNLSWLSMGNKMGRVHLGFMKALGLQDEKDPVKGFPKEKPSTDKTLAYYSIRDTLTTLLASNPNAKFIVTGHSLGAALAILFPSLLAFHGQDTILQRMACVVTHAQPRVGDSTFASYMETIVGLSYYRTVFRYDLVPRVPFDSPPAAEFKHFGSCVYYKNWYKAQMVDEVPNPNYFDPKYVISMYLNAWGDLIKALFIGKTQGKDFKEGYVSILYRMSGLILPGLASHSPRDYLNAARLSKLAYKDMV